MQSQIKEKIMSDYTYDRLKTKAREFSSFTDRWDGDNAKRIPTISVLNAINFINVLENEFEGPRPTGIAPSPDGEVMIYWHNEGRHDYVEVNFDGNGSILLCTANDKNEISQSDVTLVEENYGDSLMYGDVWSTLNDKLNGV